MKLLIVAGGGGHFSPALAVLEALPKDVEVLVVGRKYAFEGDTALSLEYQTLQSRGIPFVSLTTGRLQRKLTKHTIPSLLKTPRGFYQAFTILRKFQPDVIVSFGGYVAVPITIVGAFLKIPIVLHEQTLGAGLANTSVAKFADKICVSFDTSEKYFPKGKTILTGNPLKNYPTSNFKFSISNEKLPLLLVLGGSAGSHAINVLIEGVLPRLLEEYRVVHQTGDAKEYQDYERLSQVKDSLPEKLQKRYMLTKFIDPKDFGSVLEQSDLVISRAGINTICDLLRFEKASLLIPLPYAQNNEQMENAEFLKHTGLAEIAPQDTTSSDTLITKITTMMNNKKSYKVSKEAEKYLIKDATQRVIDVIFSVS